MIKICNVVGARPNFMKMTPIVHELERRGFQQTLVHTGQHYDARMSDVFFDELGMPKPDVFLGVGSDSHAKQTAAIMVAFESTCQELRPDLVIVSGDVNSTLAAALVAAKLQIPLAHVEAGLRSFDRAMPEEVNRVVTDRLSDLLFASEESGVTHLRHEGVPEKQIHLVGNCMVDSLVKHRDASLLRSPWKEFNLEPGSYALLTLHRPSNVDEDGPLRAIMATVNRVAERLPVLFPVHPRTRDRLNRGGIVTAPGIRLTDPLPYLTFLGLMARAKCVLTDSGGIQEETTALGVPCLTLRENTERPATISCGTNRLVGNDPAQIEAGIAEILADRWPTGSRPPLWDGRAAVRVVDVIEAWAGKRQAPLL
ncbi:non-hydrolyzing UDP-N-acetylglucosamine 2-epimerase [Singulisphaera acidiphila]|uniref:UDP-N-acetylglucosamine 2-epimerase n=1 Tax=Singulisphaera acidiphila (strain ATCC BAA-1392 / DSM 18658 / VKM B-2454 / MOB10) TaxID=886293 RepID=L0DLQ1_SINAD|nr:UDP-N-acetylglucosamine 2-epimerase (non-hydrolyzing) [Singulisphaera acidiphila]AGA29596.1 UDP-N-acetylglucosamine 2-epimerase [Singulisphaera acidiphila DSM 18658]